MKFNREHLEELTLQKIKEVNDEAGYRKYLEVPEMVEIIASIIEEKLVDKRWEACADNLIHYAKDFARYLEDNIYMNNPFVSHQNYQSASNAIEEYNRLKSHDG